MWTVYHVHSCIEDMILSGFISPGLYWISTSLFGKEIETDCIHCSHDILALTSFSQEGQWISGIVTSIFVIWIMELKIKD